MKRIQRLLLLLLWVAFTVPDFVSAQHRFTIEGKVRSLKEGDKLFIIYQTGNDQITDSTVIRNGQFILTNKIEYPVKARLVAYKNPYNSVPVQDDRWDECSFYIEPGHIRVSSSDSVKNIVVDGSRTNEQHKELQISLQANEDSMVALGRAIFASPDSLASQTAYERYSKQIQQLTKRSYQIHLAYASRHPDLYLSLMSLSHIASDPDMTVGAKEVYDKLSPVLKNTPLGKLVALELDAIAKTALGAVAPDFEQMTADGKKVSLSSFRGKYVLVDFWASWCGPCRFESPSLVAAFDKYKDKGFTILGVTLDSKAQKNAWLKAIQDDKLFWTQVTDFRGWDNVPSRIYGIRGVPSNFLIDPSGKIVAKNLRGGEVDQVLAGIFGRSH